MSRVQTEEFKKILKERLEEIGRCELCGSKRGLELHHCIPVSCGGEDNDDNLILVCNVCHTKLTPRSCLTKIGVHKAIERYKNSHILKDFYEYFNDWEDSAPSFEDACDFLDKYFLNKYEEKKVNV